MLPARHREPNHSLGDANTIGGYAAVHDRPAAFEGVDGFSYSAEILVDATGEAGERAFGGYLFFVQWSRIGASSPMGHIETAYLDWAATSEQAAASVGALRLSEVTELLNELIVAREGGAPPRRWWDAMRADDAGETEGPGPRDR